MKRILATVFLLLCLKWNAYCQNLVANGSFEWPTIPDATYALLPAESMLPWKADGKTIEIWANGMQVDGSQPTLSAHGRQNVEVLANGTALWQAIRTVPNENYVLSFFHTPRATVRSRLTVSIDARVIAAFEEDGTGLSGFQWRAFTTNFTATSTSTVVRFADSAATGAGTHLDDISVTVANPVEHAIYRFNQQETVLGNGRLTPLATQGFVIHEPDTGRGTLIGAFRINQQPYFVTKPLYHYVVTHVTGPQGASYTVMTKAEGPGTAAAGALMESSYLRGRNTLVTIGTQTRLIPRVLSFMGRELTHNADSDEVSAIEAKGTYTLDLAATQISNLSAESFAAAVARYSNSFLARGYLELGVQAR